VPGERLADGVADLAGGARGHQREHRAAEAAADHPRPERSRGQRRLHRRVGFRPGDLEVITQRQVSLRQQPPDVVVGVRHGRGRGAQQPDHVEDPLVVGDDMAGATPQDGIGKPVDVS